ncbi:MAG: YkgJ family cysteine cluster protein [Deltaproteobacteria bacterium]|nr:YkgJ family cysteine cluster protein [Deltaproteobacteria bacterium]
MPYSRSFRCLLCGECCRGRGGIYLDREGAEAAARHLGLPFPVAERLFLEQERPGLWSVLNRPGGHCLLFRGGVCLIHPVKPPICRAWPRLRALVTDPLAFLEAAEACPGLARLDFAGFSAGYREGRLPLPPPSFKAALLARAGGGR